MELLGGWDRVRRNLVGTFFLKAKADVVESEVLQPDKIILERLTYSLPSTELEREYRAVAELDNLLEAARKDYSEKQKEFELRWQLCEEKNELLQKFVSSFESYYDVSKSKQKADKKTNEKYDKELSENIRQVNRQMKELSRMKELKVELEERVRNSKIYREFMHLVVEESNGQFEDISQVIARYNELKNIRELYVEKTVKQVQLAFELKKELDEIIQQSKSEDVSSKTYLSQLEEYQIQLQVSTWRRQDNLLALKEGLRRELLVSYIPKTAIHNLYLLLCQEMKQPATLHEHQFGEQLRFVRGYLNELVKLSNRTREFLECPSDVPIIASVKSKKGKRSNIATNINN